MTPAWTRIHLFRSGLLALGFGVIVLLHTTPSLAPSAASQDSVQPLVRHLSACVRTTWVAVIGAIGATDWGEDPMPEVTTC